MAVTRELLTPLERLNATKLLVVGDIMLDRFLYGHVERISPEAPIPVFRLDREEKMLGGAGNVVRNLLALGTKASLVCVIGDDACGHEITSLVSQEAQLVPYLIMEKGRTSTSKTRYVASGQQLLRSDQETTASLGVALRTRLESTIVAEIPSAHAVVLSDYGKGVLDVELSQTIIAAAKKAKVPVFVDPKQRDVSVYAGATVLSPNLKELAAACGVDGFADQDALVKAAAALALQHRFQYVLVTQGEHGMSLVDAQGLVIHVEAQAHEVYDVSGAGDTSIATLAASYAAGATMPQAVELANIAAGIVVARRGTAVVHQTDISAALYAYRAAELQHKILPTSAAKDTVANWRRDGLRIGFTNGCFDIMHAGHVSLLTDAKSRCDKLIVAMNTDASVRALKGSSRPVNGEMDRAQILAALSMVDMVVLFNEETPLKLLELLKPDLLMKGADYTKEQVVGWQLVEAYGGSIELIPLKEGYSTTNIIRKVAAG